MHFTRGCPISDWIVKSSKLRIPAVINNLKRHESFNKFVKRNCEHLYSENKRFYKYYVRISTLNFKDNPL